MEPGGARRVARYLHIRVAQKAPIDRREEDDEGGEGADGEGDLAQVEAPTPHPGRCALAPADGDEPARHEGGEPDRHLGEPDAKEQPVVGSQGGPGDASEDQSDDEEEGQEGPEEHDGADAGAACEEDPAGARRADDDLGVDGLAAQRERGHTIDGAQGRRLSPDEGDPCRAGRDREGQASPVLLDGVARLAEGDLLHASAFRERQDVLSAAAGAEVDGEGGVRGAAAGPELQKRFVEGQALAADPLGSRDGEGELLAGPGAPRRRLVAVGGVVDPGETARLDMPDGAGDELPGFAPATVLRSVEGECGAAA